MWSSTGIESMLWSTREGSYTGLGASQSYRHTAELRDISNFLVVPLHQRGNFLDMMSLNVKIMHSYRILSDKICDHNCRVSTSGKERNSPVCSDHSQPSGILILLY